MTHIERTLSHVSPEPNSGCWLWMASGTKNGYGITWNGKRTLLAHRAVFEAFRGEIPAGLDLDHLCRVRCCVNPDHLEPVTRSENARRGDSNRLSRLRQQAITHCPKGHEYSPENTRVDRGGTHRCCRTCQRHRVRAARAAKKGA